MDVKHAAKTSREKGVMRCGFHLERRSSIYLPILTIACFFVQKTILYCVFW